MQNGTLRYGMFVMPIHNPEKPRSQCFDEDLELVQRCEEWGFDEFWVGEHHSSSVENIVMPEIFIAKALGITQKIRLGPAPVCLQYHHPFYVATRLAFLDHLSHGRLNLCFGIGGVPSDMEVYGINPKQSGAMVAESLDTILKLWSTDPPYQIEGDFWRVEFKKHLNPELGLVGSHRPYQEPHPPIAIPCVNRDSGSIQMAGSRGLQPFSHHMTHRETLVNHSDNYRRASENAGFQPRLTDWKVARNIFVADTTEEARRLARNNSVAWTIDYILKMTCVVPGLDMWKPRPEMSDADCNLDYFMDDVVIAGDPEEVTRRILDLREEVGEFGTLVLIGHDWDDRAQHMRSLELFAQEVMPALDEKSSVQP